MKRLFLIILTSLFAGKLCQAQLLPFNQPEQDACNALLLCGNSFTTPYSYQGTGLVSDLTNSPCSGGEGNSMWLRLEVNGAGIIVFTIAPLNLTDDYDFAVLDITGKSCDNLSSSDVIRCNFNNNQPGSNVNGIVGLNTTSTIPFTTSGATGGSFLQQINANAGDVYLIMINNFGDPFVGGPSSGFTIDFTGTTATFNGNNPSLTSIIPSCNNAQKLIVQVSENLKCSSIASDGSDFSVSGGSVSSAIGLNCSGTSGYTDQIEISFSAPLAPGSHSLTVKTGTDGNTLLNLCDKAVPDPSDIQFYVSPYTEPGFVSVDTPFCSELKIKLASRIRCDSLAKNGSDFTITGPEQTAVIGAYGLGCDTLNFTDSIVLLLQTPLGTDGIYTIRSQNGTDGNTVMDSCGLRQPVGDTISFYIRTYDGRLVTASDTVLCRPQYLLMGITDFSPLPFAPLNCDTAQTPVPPGKTYAAFAGRKDSSSTVNSPFSGGLAGQRAQYLFTASELRLMGFKAGIIQKLEWKITQKSSNQGYKNFTIKIGCTPASALDNSFLEGLPEAFSAASYTTQAGWNSFLLNKPYNWDGISNLIVEVCYEKVLSQNGDEVLSGITSFPSVNRRFSASVAGCDLTNQGIASPVTTLRPGIRFYISEPGTFAPDYKWSPGVFLSDSTIKNPLAYIARDITYHVSAVDRNGCTHRDSVSFALSVRNPGLSPEDTVICFGQEIRLTALGGEKYTWTTTAPGTLSCTDCPAPDVSPKEDAVYTVSIQDKYECADTLRSRVRVNPLPVVRIFPRDTIIKYGTMLQLYASGAEYYSWRPAGHLSNPNIPDPTALITAPVTFILAGLDEKGCRNSDSVRIDVDYTSPVFVPSAFTPNGDGKNDVFKIANIRYQKLQEFRVFNRWGQQVFSTTSPEEGWDGSFQGQTQEAGVYHYIIRLAYPEGRVETYKGDLTLLR